MKPENANLHRKRPLGFESLEDRSVPSTTVGDFNADGVDDLAIGSPREDIRGARDGGEVHVLYGVRGNGLVTNRVQRFDQSMFRTDRQVFAYEQFGFAVAAGDFNGDGTDDLAIGIPGNQIGRDAQAGAVRILYGRPGIGLTTTGTQGWHQDSPGVNSPAEAGDGFGAVLSTGDYNGDGADDLAVGVPREDLGSMVDGGAVTVLYGRRGAVGQGGGITGSGDQFISQSQVIDGIDLAGRAERGDQFGFALASGDFNGDGRDDLAIGVPFDRVNGIDAAGSVNVLFGSRYGLTPAIGGNERLHQDTAGLETRAEVGDHFGYSLAAGSFNANPYDDVRDIYDDLVIGVPHEDLGSVQDAGIVHVVFGERRGMSTSRHVDIRSDLFQRGASNLRYMQFGFSLDATEFSELAIGAPGSNSSGEVFLGHVYDNSGFVLNRRLRNFSPQPGDLYGTDLALGNFDGGQDFYHDLVVVSPYDDIGNNYNAGSFQVNYAGYYSKTPASPRHLWTQAYLPGDGVEAYDALGGYPSWYPIYV